MPTASENSTWQFQSNHFAQSARIACAQHNRSAGLAEATPQMSGKAYYYNYYYNNYYYYY